MFLFPALCFSVQSKLCMTIELREKTSSVSPSRRSSSTWTNRRAAGELISAYIMSNTSWTHVEAWHWPVSTLGGEVTTVGRNSCGFLQTTWRRCPALPQESWMKQWVLLQAWSNVQEHYVVILCNINDLHSRVSVVMSQSTENSPLGAFLKGFIDVPTCHVGESIKKKRWCILFAYICGPVILRCRTN